MDNYPIASPEQASIACEVMRKVHLYTAAKGFDEQKSMEFEQFIRQACLCFIEDEADLSLVLQNNMECTFVINSTNHELIKNVCVRELGDFLIYDNSDVVSEFQMASPNQKSDALNAIRKLRLCKMARLATNEHHDMLFEYPKVKLVNLLKERPDLHTQEILHLLTELEEGNQRAYSTLIKTQEFKKLTLEIEQGHTAHKSACVDFEVEAKQLIHEARLCLIEDENDYNLLLANGMRCTCVVSSNNPVLLDLARNGKFGILLYQKRIV